MEFPNSLRFHRIERGKSERFVNCFLINQSNSIVININSEKNRRESFRHQIFLFQQQHRHHGFTLWMIDGIVHKFTNYFVTIMSFENEGHPSRYDPFWAWFYHADNVNKLCDGGTLCMTSRD